MGQIESVNSSWTPINIRLQFGLKAQTAAAVHSYLLCGYMKWSFSVRIPTIWIKARLQEELDHEVAREELMVVLVQEAVAGDGRRVGDRQVEEAVLVLRDGGEISHLPDHSVDITFLLGQTIRAEITARSREFYQADWRQRGE